MKKLSDFVMDFIARQGVKDVFMLPGGGCMHLVDSLGKHENLRYICNLHEQACAVAADAYAQYTNNLGVALVTTGPGGTNAITGVAGSWIDSIPCLIISGQVKRADCAEGTGLRQLGFQEINIVELVRPISKYAITINDPSTIRYHLEKAVFMARTGRPGPVWIDIPLDVQAAMIDETELQGFDSSEIEQLGENRMLKQKILSVVELLNNSERPVILAGNGIRLGNAKEEFLRLIEILKIPVLTTWKAIDFLPESHWLYVGRPGSIGQRGANFSLQNSDCLLCIGARLDFGQTGYNHKNFARAAKKIIVDIDPSEIAKMQTEIDVPVAADCKDFIIELLLQKNKLKVDYANWLERCKNWQSRYPVVLSEYWEEKEYVNHYVLIDVLSDEMTGDDLLIPGSSGACSEVSMQAFRVTKGMRIFNTEGLGPMGFGIPAAIGGCIASGRKRTICIDGDGGFQMNIQELEIVRRLNLPIKFFVLNNDGYGSIRATQRNYFEGRFVASNPANGLTLPKILKIADAYGIRSEQILVHDEIRQKICNIMNFDGPVVCEVMISPDQITSPRLSSVQRPDGSMESKPLEDLWPFLKRKEFLSNMIIDPLTN